MLNPKLHNSLKRLFGEVRISNEDKPLVIGSRLDHDGKERRWKEQGGETYNVCCPMCGDTRFRLSISYAWGLDKKEKYPTSKLVNCFNERCQERYEEDRQDRGNVRLFLERRLRESYMKQVNSGNVHVRAVTKDRGKKEALIPFPEAAWCEPLDTISKAHYAAQFIRSRNFDPVVLYKTWGVVFCHDYPVKANNRGYQWLANRLFIPTPNGGWQARAIRSGQTPKYFTCPGWKKSHQLYGCDVARGFPEFTLLCEGVTDVWRVGGPAVAIFGKSLSHSQTVQLRQNWNTVGVMLDPDAETDKVNSVRRAMNQLNNIGINTFRVTLPGEKDAADCTQDVLWKCVEKSAASAGFTYVKRPEERAV